MLYIIIYNHFVKIVTKDCTQARNSRLGGGTPQKRISTNTSTNGVNKGAGCTPREVPRKSVWSLRINEHSYYIYSKAKNLKCYNFFLI